MSGELSQSQTFFSKSVGENVGDFESAGENVGGTLPACKNISISKCLRMSSEIISTNTLSSSNFLYNY